ncbi:hypothetical protein HYN59_07375 [Flavobacterium album]|uniref:Lipocalin-like domain-containing protein n=1 Tax=Flavobacterium album TaxID=2175091 RepID=A0A2S1QX21_9FLAO|nr:lipocalin family protein [Flavobacterium album]AWH84956.1 hypothetical protein HYN59_07375 [Flavobacterium album]
MKKLTMVAFAAAAFTALSCSDDDNNTTNNNATVSGKWMLTAVTASHAVDGNDDGVSSTNLITEGGACFTDSYLQFGANHTVANFLSAPMLGDACFTAEADGEYSVNGNKVTVTVNYEGDNDTTVYTQNGNTLTALVPDFYEVEVTVNGQTTSDSIDATLVFTKQ